MIYQCGTQDMSKQYQINLGRHENNNRFLEYNILLKISQT